MINKFFERQDESKVSQNIPLVILDTNVLVAGLCRCKDSLSYKILQNIQKGNIPLAATQRLFLEYESVITREKILELIGASLEKIRLVLDALVAIAQKSEVYYLWRPNLPDESDNYVLESAIATGAIIITKNIHDFKASELKFPELVVLTPQQFCDIYL